MKKAIIKSLSVVLAVVLTLTAAPLSGFVGLELPDWLDFSIKSSAATSGTCGENVCWKLDESSGKLTISGTGSMYNYDGDTPWCSLFNPSRVKSVVINNGVTSIGDGAFAGCKTLISVTIPNSVKTIGESAFDACANLISIIIPDSVTIIGDYAFEYCGSLTDVKLGDNIMTIGICAFYCCDNLTSIAIPDSVTTIGDYAFGYCTNLGSLIVPKNVITIGKSILWCCSRIDNITVDINNKYYSSDEYGVLFNKDKTTLIQYPIGDKRTNYTVPNEVTIISEHAFYGCNNIENITIPNQVTTIGNYAFYDCYELTNITIPNSVTSIGEYAFYSCDSLASVKIGNSVTSIEKGTFELCYNLAKVTIGKSVSTIDKCAFNSCFNLTSIIVDSNNQYYSSDEYGVLFNQNKTTLIQYPIGNTRTSYTIPNDLKTIGAYAFDDCDSLTSITIPDSVTIISDSALHSCSSLTDVYYSGTEEQWNNISIGSYNECLTSATIHYNSTGPNSGNTDCSVYGHTEGEVVVENEVMATCVANGSYDNVVYCIVCNAELSRDTVVVKATGEHIYVNGVCGCGKNESDETTNNETYTGILESTVWTVTDTENWVSEIRVNGLEYNVKKNLIATETGASAENKEVIFVVEDGDVVWFDTCENIKASVNVGISLSESEITYYDSKFSTDKLMVKVAVSSTCSSSFPGDLSVLNSILNADLTLENITISANEPLNFNGSKTYSIDASSKDVEFGKTVIVATLYADLDKKYMKDSPDLIYSGVSCNVSGIQNGSHFNESASTSVLIKKLAGTKPSSNQDSTSSVNSAAQKLETLSGTNAVNINGDITGTLNKLFTAEERKMIGATLLTESALICIPEEKLDLSSKVFESMMGIKSSWFGTIHNEEVSVTFVSKTDEYGEIEVKFTCDLYNVDVNNSKVGFYGNINYEIIGGKGKKKLTDDMSKSGFAGGLACADVTAFANAVYTVANEMLDSSYEFGDTANDAAEIVFGQTVDEILRQTKYGKYLSVVKKVIFAGKEIIIECPVDVYIYNSNNELVAAVENNEVILTNEFAQISVEGDVKTVWLYDDTYRIEYCSLAEYEMSVTIKEYGYSNCLLRTVSIENIPLKIGTNFEQFIDKNILEETNYSLTSNGNQIYSPVEDVCHLHQHETTMGWENIQEATCTQYGIKVAICDLCNDWCKEIIPAIGHKYENGACTVCDEDDPNYVPVTPDEYEYAFTIKSPSRTEIRNKDGIILHANVEGNAPDGSYVRWESSNGNFSTSADGLNLKIIAKNKGWTTFTAILCDADGNELARDSVEMYSKSGFFDKIGGFFRGLFGMTKIYEN